MGIVDSTMMIWGCCRLHHDDMRGKKDLYLAECWFSSLSKPSFIECIVSQRNRQGNSEQKGNGNNVARATFSWLLKIYIYIFKILENISHAYFLICYFDLSVWGLLCHSMERVGGRRRPVRRGDLPLSSQSCLWLSRRAAATRVHKKPAEAG